MGRITFGATHKTETGELVFLAADLELGFQPGSVMTQQQELALLTRAAQRMQEVMYEELARGPGGDAEAEAFLKRAEPTLASVARRYGMTPAQFLRAET